LTLQLANAEQQVKNAEESTNRMKAYFEKRLQDKDAELKKCKFPHIPSRQHHP
jgi:hypothetical protein